MIEKSIKKPLLKAILFYLILDALMFLVYVVVTSLQIEPYTNILFVVLHASFVAVSIMIGIVIIKKFKWKFSDIGIRGIEKKSLKNTFYLIPFFIIVMLPLFAGFRDNDTNVSTFKILLFLGIHYIVVGIHEEFWYRGIILSLFEDNIKKAIIIPAIIFGIGHVTNIIHILNDLTLSNIMSLMEQMIFAFIIGVVYAEVLVITKSIFPLIFFHTVWNFNATITNEDSFIMGVIPWLLLILYAILMWIKLTKKAQTAHNRIVNASPSEGGSGYEKHQSGVR